MLVLLATLIITSPSWTLGQSERPPVAPKSLPVAPAVAPLLAQQAAGQQLLTFCVSNWDPLPIALCSDTSDNFTGHDVELIRLAGSRLGLQEGTDFRFSCEPFDQLLQHVNSSDPDGPCSAAVGAITITSERQQDGIKFSYPYFKSGLGILTKAYTRTSSGWGFFDPFHWTLWLALFLTLLIFPPLVFMLEFLSLRKRIHREDVLPGVIESGWRSAVTFMLFDGFAVTSLGARAAVLAFCFLALLTTSTYTANLAAFITVQTISSTINSIDDLRGRAVGTNEIYIDRLSEYRLTLTAQKLRTGADYVEWGRQVASGQLAAIIRDEPLLLWLANNAPRCDLTVLQDSPEEFEYGIAFRVGTSQELVNAWTLALLDMQEDGTLDWLKDTWIVDPNSGCQSITQVTKDATAISFTDLSGLWMLLAAGLGLGCLLMLGQRSLRRWQKHHGKSSGQPQGRFGAGEPLPEGRRPSRLISAVRGHLPRLSSKRRISATASNSVSGSSRGRPIISRPVAAGSCVPVQTTVLDSSATTTGRLFPYTLVHGQARAWDVESQASLPDKSLGSADANAQPPSNQAQPRRPQQPSPSSPQLQPMPSPFDQKAPASHAQPVTPVSAPLSPAEEVEEQLGSGRSSALQAVDSIYAAHSWKSMPRSQGSPHSR